jgi:hypothetical protein
MPGHAVLARAGLDRRDYLGGDTGVDIGALGVRDAPGHRKTSVTGQASLSQLVTPVTKTQLSLLLSSVVPDSGPGDVMARLGALVPAPVKARLWHFSILRRRRLAVCLSRRLGTRTPRTPPSGHPIENALMHLRAVDSAGRGAVRSRPASSFPGGFRAPALRPAARVVMAGIRNLHRRGT